MTFLSLAIVMVVNRYITLDLDVYFPQQQSVNLAHQIDLGSVARDELYKTVYSARITGRKQA